MFWCLLHDTLFTWLFYKSINLHLNINLLHHTHLAFLKNSKQQTQSWKQQQYLFTVEEKFFLITTILGQFAAEFFKLVVSVNIFNTVEKGVYLKVYSL